MKEKKQREIELYVEEMGKLPPAHLDDDWQWVYRGTPEERARLKVWMGYEDDEQQERGEQPDQEESLF